MEELLGGGDIAPRILNLGSGAHPFSYPMGTGGTFPECDAARS